MKNGRVLLSGFKLCDNEGGFTLFDPVDLLEIQTFGTHHSKWFSSVDALAVRTM